MNTNKTTPWTKPATPSFFDPKNAGVWSYTPKIPEIFKEAVDWRSSRFLRPAASDKKKVHLLLIDVQRDFCFPQGTLYVGGRSGTGAIDDSRRIAEFVYRNLGQITSISPTLDTHVPFQIFSRSFWTKEDGKTPVDAFTTITSADIIAGRFKPSLMATAIVAKGNSQWLTKQVIHYCQELERAGKYNLYIWPEHCLLGTVGHTLAGVVEEAVFFHAYARGSQNSFQIKGGNPLTENYSVLRPEVLTRWDGGNIPGAQRNTQFIQALLEADYVIPAGQASSHCVKSSLDDLLDEILKKDPALARKVYVMKDCMSSVTVPDGKGGFIADFTDEAEKALKRFEDAGMHVVESTTPIDRWPDFVL